MLHLNPNQNIGKVFSTRNTESDTNKHAMLKGNPQCFACLHVPYRHW